MAIIHDPVTHQMSIVEETICKICRKEYKPFHYHCIRCHMDVDILGDDHTCSTSVYTESPSTKLVDANNSINYLRNESIDEPERFSEESYRKCNTVWQDNLPGWV